jgi:YihY family inner membrane protein
MNPLEKAVRRADATQQSHRPVAFAFGVIKKFGDDNGGALVANLTYAAFISVFPLLLILVTVLVKIAASNASLQHQVISGATTQFPLIGKQLVRNIRGLQRSTVVGLIAGLLLLLWGVTRLAQAGLFAMAQVWNVPGPARPGYFPRLWRSLGFLAVLAAGVITSTLLAGLVTYGHHALGFRILAQVLAGVTDIGLYLVGFRVLTPQCVRSGQLVPGAIAGGIVWTVLQALGAYLVHHYLRSDSVYGIFASVLGLVAWIYLSVQIAVYAAEVNAVLARRLWPRSLVQPPLTQADRTSMALQALQNQRRPEQHVNVTFDDQPSRTVGGPADVDHHFPAKPSPPARRHP